MISIITVKCKRCGKEIATTSRSILGLDSLKAKYGNICQGCMDQDEQYRMLDEMANKIIGDYNK
jgi:hypothetical protein